jgi:uncharacterized membrane protein YfcA
MDPLTLTIMGVLSVAALVASIFGFGVALIAMPVLAVMVDMKTATPLVALVIMTVVVTILSRQWREVQFQSVWRLILASVFGVPIGLFLLNGLHDQVMKLSLALIIIAFSCYNVFTPHMLVLKTERASYLFGIVSGILGGAYPRHAVGVLFAEHCPGARWPLCCRAVDPNSPAAVCLLTTSGTGGHCYGQLH